VNLQKMLKRSKLQTRAIDSFTEYPGLTEQLLRIQGLSSESWYPPSIREALSVPAVFRAVTMISNLVGSLTMQAWRNGRVLEGQQVPTLVSRPGVFQTPRDFFRDSAYCLATRGEYLWWIVDRDDDGLAKRLMLLPPHEVTVRWNQRMPLLREYEWRNRKIDADDIEHGTFSREPGTLRGQGPLRLMSGQRAFSSVAVFPQWS
jgi:phage portal protein BeeE